MRKHTTSADITSYEQAVKYCSKGKSSTGRKLRSFMLRVNDEGTVVIGHAWRQWHSEAEKCTWCVNDFAELRVGDILTFTTTSDEAVRMAASLATTLHKVFGLAWTRTGKGRYEVWRYDWSTEDNYYYSQYKHREAYEHFKGMEWSLSAGVCLNPRPAILTTVDRDQRKVWVAQLKKFRRALHTRVKLGVVQSIIDQSDDIFVGPEEIATEVLAAIKEGNVHTDLIERLVGYSKRQSYSRQATNESVKRITEGIINSNSVKFRQEFGVLQK